MDEMRRLIFDSLGLVAFDRQMGLIRQNRDNPDALVLFNMARKVLQYVFELDVKPSMWRYISTPAYRKMMSVAAMVADSSLGQVMGGKVAGWEVGFG